MYLFPLLYMCRNCDMDCTRPGPERKYWEWILNGRYKLVWDTYYRKNLACDTYFGKNLGLCQENRLLPHNLSETTNTITTSK